MSKSPFEIKLINGIGLEMIIIYNQNKKKQYKKYMFRTSETFLR